MKKAFALVISLLLVLSTLVGFCGCDKDVVEEEGEKDKLILFLGDSIAEAVLGPSPLIERENYGYYALVGRRSKGYYYRNRSVSGHQTIGMVEYLVESEGENAMMTKTYVKEADVICVSIIGNDVLQNHFDDIFIELMQNNYETLDGLLAEAAKNIDVIVRYLKTTNPTATLIFQTVYNPIYADTPMVREPLRQTLRSDYGIGKEDLRAKADIIIDRMNDVLRNYIVENPGAFYLLDVNARFDEIFNEDEQAGAALIYPDGTHPSNIGHAVIADMYQEYLESIGKTDRDHAVQVYKDIKNEQLERLYADELDVAEAKAQINACTTCSEITDKYFELIDEKTPAYHNDFSSFYIPESEKTYFSEDRSYYVSDMSILDLPLGGFLSPDSGMVFKADGTFEINIKPLPAMIRLANSVLKDNVDMSTVDLEYWSALYAEPLFPYFTLEDPIGSFSELGGLYLYLNGFDPDDPDIKALNDHIVETGELPAGFTIPTDLSITIKGKYSVHQLHSDYSGDHTAVFLGDYTEKGEPMFVLTVDTDENGNDTILMQFFILKFNLLGIREN